MRFSAGSPLALTMLLLLGAAPALQAQSSPAPASAAGIYSCIDDQGRRITADRPIAGCSAKEQRILNRDGSLKTVYPPTLTVDERAEKEAAERKAAEARAAQADAVRRDRNLLARYPNEAPHRKAREAALDTVRVAIKASEKRLQALEAERKPLLDEAEFYIGKTLPPKLRAQLDANDAAASAQLEAAISQQAELERVTRLYDAELARLKQLWSGAAPGSMGPLPAPGGAAPLASGASNLKASTLR
ncbi:MAG TPA: hypothetical protein PLB41_04040 [Rubrivivax sp.]|nr:hypothetical protein [Rubrivivax sp.]HPO19207.1 hypothetical protein [Rubrivivax sp.]